jgi:CHASE2 domain-containing sensor protein
MKENEEPNCERGIAAFLKDRPKLNMSIDIVLFIMLMAMAGLGFLIKFKLVDGETRNLLYGSNIDLSFLGLGRHQWGTIHLYISIAFIVFLVLHIIFHWKIILCYFTRLFPSKFTRIFLGVLIALLGLLMFVFSFMVTPDQIEKARQHQGGQNRSHAIGQSITPFQNISYIPAS